MGHAGVGLGGSCREWGEVCHVGVGGSCRGGVSHVEGVGWVTWVGWGGSHRGGVG